MRHASTSAPPSARLTESPRMGRLPMVVGLFCSQNGQQVRPCGPPWSTPCFLGDFADDGRRSNRRPAANAAGRGCGRDGGRFVHGHRRIRPVLSSMVPSASSPCALRLLATRTEPRCVHGRVDGLCATCPHREHTAFWIDCVHALYPTVASNPIDDHPPPRPHRPTESGIADKRLVLRWQATTVHPQACSAMLRPVGWGKGEGVRGKMP